jgi:acyl carrier protein phosphodiesterase
LNFLAHLLLSEPTPEGRIGNLLGDFHKGPLPPEYPEAFRRGITLHHQIDAYTDSHPIVQQSKLLIDPSRRRFAGILIDVFYDYFLASQWNAYANVPLPVFAQQVYTTLEEYEPLLPSALHHIMPYMIAQDWLTSYQTSAGIRAALKRISTYFRRRVDLTPGMDDLAQHESILREHFNAFFPDIRQYVDGLIV